MINMETGIVQREFYLSQIRPLIDRPIIKVLSGFRHSGKTTIMKMLMDELRETGIEPDKIIYIDFDNVFLDLNSADKLLSYLNAKIENNKFYYIFLDEVQRVRNWEQTIYSLNLYANLDLYIAGSNSDVLLNLETNKYIEIKITTLSFNEHLLFKNFYSGSLSKLDDEIQIFFRSGGFPIKFKCWNESSIYNIVNDVISQIIRQENVQSIDLLEQIICFILINTGVIFSIQDLEIGLKSRELKFNIITLYRYINIIEKTFLIRRIPRYNCRVDREIIQDKLLFYVSDHSLINPEGNSFSSISKLENIMVMEMIRHGYSTYFDIEDEKKILVFLKNRKKLYIRLPNSDYELLINSPIICDEYSNTVKNYNSEYKEIKLTDFFLMDKM